LFAAGEFVKTGGSSGRYPIDALIASRSDTGFPLIHASPSVGRVSDVNIRIVVVFPAPFGPRKPYTVPWSTVRLSPSTAISVPNRFVSSRVSMASVSRVIVTDG